MASEQTLFLWTNSCRAARTSPVSICRAQRLLLGKPERTIAYRESVSEGSQAVHRSDALGVGAWKYWSVV